MRKFSLVVCVLVMPCLSSARNNKASWDNLSSLQPGQKIEVLEMNTKRHSGIFLSFSDTSISLKEAAADQTIPKQSVRRVTLMKNKHRLRNALIGAGIGAGVGAIIGVAVNHNGKDPSFIPEAAPLILGTLGLVIGAVAGVAAPIYETLYKVNPH
jgi:hypothetical protein